MRCRNYQLLERDSLIMWIMYYFAVNKNANWWLFRAYCVTAGTFGVSLTSSISAKDDRGVQLYGSSCCGSQAGSAVSRSKTSYRYAPGSTLWRRQVEKIESMIEACKPDSSLPKKYQFLRLCKRLHNVDYARIDSPNS